MPDQDNTNTTPVTAPATPVIDQGGDVPAPVIPDIPAAPVVPVAPIEEPLGVASPANLPENHTDNSAIIADVAIKIAEAHNILVALSSDPSVDEMCSAIGLALYLDRLGKRVTAIYSGATPNALKFLKPEETFEKTADILQDFVIALNKEKADHLRYKLDGEYVKIFITPYRSKITSDDLEFSYGDFNVDLVLALDVANGIDLDDALREHGRIMHDAVVINITTGKPGKLGEIEWSDKTASSVSEMVVEMLFGMNSQQLEKEEATALLTGIVAATNRFASAGTTSKTMKIASRLMECGANQQLISKNITPDTENELFSFDAISETPKDKDGTKLDIQHGNEKDASETKEISTSVNEKDSTLLADLKAAEDSLSQVATEVTTEKSDKPVRIEDEKEESEPEPVTALNPEPALPAPIANEASVAEGSSSSEKTFTPPADLLAEPTQNESNKYSQMLEEALAEAGNDDMPAGIISSPSESPEASFPNNPAFASAPSVASEPEINGVPEMNYMPAADENILPPPPAPPVDLNATPEFAPLGPQPAMQDQIYYPQVSSPDSFKIPGA